MKCNVLILTAMLAAYSGFVGSSYAQDASGLLLPPATYSNGQGQSSAAPLSAPAGQGADQDDSPEDAAFSDALRQIAPLTPEQIERARRQLDDVDRAQGTPLQPIHPVTRSIGISLRSGERPATLKVSPGWISTITFSDVTGKPWPVESVANGNSSAYTVQSAGPDTNTNIIMISALQSYVPSNIAVTLSGATVPVLLTLQPSSSEVDFRVDAQVDQRGPNAAYDIVSSDVLPSTNDSLMLGFLDGVPPTGATKLKTSNRNVEVWRLDGMFYVRSTSSLLSPAYVSKQSNVSGVNVYVLNETPVLMVSRDGRLENVNVMR